MNKAELIDAVANATGGNRSAASDAVDAVLSSIQKSLVSGDKVTLPGFGTFEVR
ncbi:MAG TPA: HU family DNA-binding protein, partial [Acidimicrobiia bacterium]